MALQFIWSDNLIITKWVLDFLVAKLTWTEVLSVGEFSERIKITLASGQLKAVFDLLKHYTDYKHSQEWAKFLKECQVK